MCANVQMWINLQIFSHDSPPILFVRVTCLTNSTCVTRESSHLDILAFNSNSNYGKWSETKFQLIIEKVIECYGKRHTHKEGKCQLLAN